MGRGGNRAPCSGGQAVEPRRSHTQPLLLEGQVVELFEQDGERRARIVLRLPAVLDIAAGAMPDIHLGDRVVVDGSITVTAVRAHTCDDPVARGV
jgi:hypothetical protein